MNPEQLKSPRRANLNIPKCVKDGSSTGPFMQSMKLDNGCKSESAIMASEKKRRKQSAIGRKPQDPTGQKPRPKDGDRRHRGADMGRLAQQYKEATRQWNLDVGWTDSPKESE
jgi:hypothetical protein